MYKLPASDNTKLISNLLMCEYVAEAVLRDPQGSWLAELFRVRCGSVLFYRTAPHRMILLSTKPHRTAP